MIFSTVDDLLAANICQSTRRSHRVSVSEVYFASPTLGFRDGQLCFHLGFVTFRTYIKHIQ